jgi:hypothetical protein
MARDRELAEKTRYGSGADETEGVWCVPATAEELRLSGPVSSKREFELSMKLSGREFEGAVASWRLRGTKQRQRCPGVSARLSSSATSRRMQTRWTSSNLPRTRSGDESTSYTPTPPYVSLGLALADSNYIASDDPLLVGSTTHEIEG